MKKATLRILGICLFCSLAISKSALADDNTLAQNIDGGYWKSIYEQLAGQDFNSLDGFSKHAFIAAAHMTDHNHIAFESRKKLTDTDWTHAQEHIGAPDATYLSVERAIFNALVLEIHGDYSTAFKYCERGARILDSGKRPEEMQSWEVSKVVGQFGTIDGICGVIGHNELLDRPAQFRVESSLLTVGKLMRALKDVSDLEALITDTTMSDSAQAATRSRVDASAADNEAAEKIRQENRLKDAETMVSLFSRVDVYSRTALFQYCKGNSLRILGKEQEALQEYSAAISSDPACHMFWKAYLDLERNQKMIDVHSKVTKDYVKEGKVDSNAILFTIDSQTAMGKPKNAVSEFTKYLKTNPANSIALAERGRAYFELKDYAKATLDAAAAVAADSTNFEGWYVLAVTAQATADPKATEYFEKVFDLSPTTLSMYTEAKVALNKY